jgi:hypothetical protein
MPRDRPRAVELLLDLVERLLAEVAVLEHLLCSVFMRELADGGDVRRCSGGSPQRTESSISLTDMFEQLAAASGCSWLTLGLLVSSNCT